MSMTKKFKLSIIISFGFIVAVFSTYGFLLFYPIDDVVVIQPTFTASAYQKGGFYDYYCTSGGPDAQIQQICKEHNQTCSISCLTVKEVERFSKTEFSTTSSKSGLIFLAMIQVKHFVTDQEVALNPEILSKYKKVVVLHNEYVTREEFEAITNHPRVLMLYADALHAEVSYDKEDKTVTLVRGHGYKVDEAFNWTRANPSEEEKDIVCMNKTLLRHVNIQYLPCYPEDIWLNLTLQLVLKIELLK